MQGELLKLQGVVEHVIFENPETGYAVFEVDAGGTDVVVSGNVGSVDNGMSVVVYGQNDQPPELRRTVPRRKLRGPPCRRIPPPF